MLLMLCDMEASGIKARRIMGLTTYGYRAGYFKLRSNRTDNCDRCNALIPKGMWLWWRKSGDKRHLCVECIKIWECHKRAGEYGVTNTLTVEQWKQVLERYGDRCLKCGAADVGPDHVVPMSAGGGNEMKNIQPLCSACNKRKGAKTEDYRAG